MKSNSWGIKQRVVFLALAPAVTIALALTPYFLFLRYDDVDTALLSRGAALTRQLAPAAEYGAFSGNRAELQRLLNAVASEEDVAAVSLHDSAGSLLASAGSPRMGGDVTALPDGWHGSAGDGEIAAFHAKIFRQPLTFDDPFQLPATTEAAAPAKLLGSVTLEMSRARLVARKREILLVTLLATLAVLAAAALLARRLGRDITEPVLALENAVEHLRSGNLDARAPRHPSGTLASLETGFNEMAAALAASQRRSANALADSEAELSRQLRFAQAMLDAQAEAGIGLMIVEQGRIVFANQAIGRIFGYGPDEIKSMANFIALIHPDDRARIMGNHLRRLAGETCENRCDFTLMRRNGTEGYADLAMATIAIGDHVQMLAVIVDITERKRAETRLAEAHRELLVKKEEAEHASQAKSRFLAATSHDLRQPLHALSLFAAELEAMAVTPEQQRLSAQIGTAAGAMGELLDALLDVSRLDTGDIVPHRQQVALGPLLESISAAHRQSARAKGLRLRLHPTTAWVESDPHLLRRMVGNLIANAVRYTHHGGVLVGVRRSGGSVRIEVWDSGIGIDAVHLPHLFQEFYQVGNPERDAAKGLGLGLAITDHLGRLLGHKVEVRSRPDHGSVFSITLPGIVPGVSMEESSPALPAGARVLVVGTDGGASHILCGLLASWGYEAIAVEPGAQMKEAMDTAPDLIILDDCCLDLMPPATCVTGPCPSLILLGKKPEAPFPTHIPVAGHLPKPLRPARLRALLHHLLVEKRAEESPTP
ncbi:MAG: ATP-binding protein [Candidatus Nitricoxidivorans perseverans]|uniref:histidine kinase n=1 Tax=Candidatus Nitricoxidivorans perseverans TaxID=2975601 RepID=A0AA49FJQ8_9PROT|nr:MAG: ATP-binding protein [Candidatus Nitricoxidivorans perseverans]